MILASYKEFGVLLLLFLFNSVRRIGCRSSLDIWFSAENSSDLKLFSLVGKHFIIVSNSFIMGLFRLLVSWFIFCVLAESRNSFISLGFPN